MTVTVSDDSSSPKLGIIAGEGKLPLLIAEAYRSARKPYFLLGIEGFAAEVDMVPFEHALTPLGAVGEAIDLLKTKNCGAVVMAGRVIRPDLQNLHVDRLGEQLISRIVTAPRRGDDRIMRLVIEAIENEGFRVLEIEDVLDGLTLQAGVLGHISPGVDDHGDIEVAIEVVREMGHLDIGQGVVVKQRQVLAVEAVEGTDAMLDRCATFQNTSEDKDRTPCGVLVKMPKPYQERRADLPVIGVTTINKTAAAGLAGIAVAAGEVFVIDKDSVAKAADDHGIFVFGLPHDRIDR